MAPMSYIEFVDRDESAKGSMTPRIEIATEENQAEIR